MLNVKCEWASTDGRKKSIGDWGNWVEQSAQSLGIWIELKLETQAQQVPYAAPFDSQYVLLVNDDINLKPQMLDAKLLSWG